MLHPSDDDIANRIEDNGQLATEHPRRAEKDGANLRRDQIAKRMWDDYQRVLRERVMYFCCLAIISFNVVIIIFMLHFEVQRNASERTDNGRQHTSE